MAEKVGVLATESISTDEVRATLGNRRDQFDVVEVESGGDALDRVEAGAVDCLLSADTLADMTGLELLERVRALDRSLPFLMVAEDDSEVSAGAAFTAGVTDYLPAGSDSETVAARIERAVSVQYDRESQEREFLTLADVAPVPMLVVGGNYEVQYANPTARETVGDEEAEALVGESVLTFVLDEERTVTVDRVDRVLADREPAETREYQFLTLDGGRRDARGTIVPVTFEGTDAAMIVLDDVTDQRFHERRAEKQRKQIEQLHDVGVELAGCESPDAVYELMVEAADAILDLDLCLIGVVEDGHFTLGASSTEMDTDGYIEPPIDSEEAGLSGKAYREGESYHVNDVTEFPDANPVQDYHSFIGVPIGEFGVFQAVAYEEAAFSGTDLELVEILAGHVRAALIRLEQQRQLREQRDQLARENERLDEFASIVSHDLRNPLNVIEGRLELARRGADGDHLRIATDAAGRMETLIDDLLTLARQGEVVSSVEATELDELVSECWTTVETNEAALVVETDTAIRADPERLRHVFENLFRNAVEHGSTGNRPAADDAVEYGSTAAGSQSGEGVTITVGTIENGFFLADDGPGIPPEDRTEVFDSGFSTREDGTGLGLAIVEDVVEAHGWEVRATESEHGGARFDVTGVEFAD